MVPAFFFPFGIFAVLMQDVLELRSSRYEYKQRLIMHSPTPTSFRELNVTFPRNMEHLPSRRTALVDDADYQLATSISTTWRVNKKGYVVFNKRDRENGFKSVYLHSLIMDGIKSRHVNGDLLDNRRNNLKPISKKDNQDYNLIRVGMSPVEITQETNQVSGMARVFYEEKTKIYEGGLISGIPQGFGQLIETKENKLSLGTWNKGVLIDGIILAYKPLPTQMSFFPRFRDVDHMRIVQNKAVQRPSDIL